MAKKIVLCLAVLAMVCGYAAISMAGEGPETVTFDTPKKGDTHINFPHWQHQERLECSQCHHTKNDDGTQGPYVKGQEKACTTCHEFDKDRGHKNCKDCHKANGGPTKCGACHTK